MAAAGITSLPSLSAWAPTHVGITGGCADRVSKVARGQLGGCGLCASARSSARRAGQLCRGRQRPANLADCSADGDACPRVTP